MAKKLLFQSNINAIEKVQDRLVNHQKMSFSQVILSTENGEKLSKALKLIDQALVYLEDIN